MRQGGVTELHKGTEANLSLSWHGKLRTRLADGPCLDHATLFKIEAEVLQLLGLHRVGGRGRGREGNVRVGRGRENARFARCRVPAGEGDHAGGG